MRYRQRTHLDDPKHAGRPGPWSQLPWRVLGMLFITALLLASQQHRTSWAPTDIPTSNLSTQQHH